ncbi:MAG: hypothetical protein P8M14_04945 [Flavobacteriaceae bacterium]|nr:hypothetical protein [Flavobacteriaceae bacterium]
MFSYFEVHLTDLTYILSKKVIPYIYILFFGCFSCGMVGQNLELKITSVDPLQNHVLNAITFKKNHNLETDIYKEITNIHSDLKKEGFFVAIVDTIIKDAEKYEAVFNLGKKTDNLILILPQEIRTNSSIKYNDSIRIKTKGFENFTNLLLTNLDATGNSFSEISFTKPTYLKDTLILNLNY